LLLETAQDKTSGDNRRAAGEPTPTAYVWNNVWGWGQEDAAYRLANAGFDVFSMDMEGYGRSTRPTVMNDPCNLARAQQTRSLPLQLETLGAMTAAVADVLRNNLPADYYDKVTTNMLAVTLAGANAAARKYIDPDHLAIVIVGDRAKIEQPLAATKIGPIVILDMNGDPVPAKVTP
jgi:hypothetical protein